MLQETRGFSKDPYLLVGTTDSFILTGCGFYICPNTAQFRGKIKRAESIPASPVFKFYQLLEGLNSYSILHRNTGIWCGTGTHVYGYSNAEESPKLEAPSVDHLE